MKHEREPNSTVAHAAVQDWLLEATPAELSALPDAISQHLSVCAACRQLLAETQVVDAVWRGQPTSSPPAAPIAKLASTPATTKSTARSRWRSWLGLATIAVVAGFVLRLASAPSALAAERWMDQLIDASIELSATDDPAERQQSLQKAAVIASKLQSSPLTDADRELAAVLVASNRELAETSDPMDHAEQYDALADRLLEQLQTTSQAGDPVKTSKQTQRFRKVVEHGLDASLLLVQSQRSMDAKGKRRMERMLASDQQRRERLTQLVKDVPIAVSRPIKETIKPRAKRYRAEQRRVDDASDRVE